MSGTSVFLSDGSTLVPQNGYISVGYFAGAFSDFSGLETRDWTDITGADYIEVVTGAINPAGEIAGSGTPSGISGKTLHMWIFSSAGTPSGILNTNEFGLYSGSDANVWVAKGDSPIPPQFNFITAASADSSVYGADTGDNLILQSAVPEPSSFALLAGCFGLAWVMVRRRR